MAHFIKRFANFKICTIELKDGRVCVRNSYYHRRSICHGKTPRPFYLSKRSVWIPDDRIPPNQNFIYL